MGTGASSSKQSTSTRDTSPDSANVQEVSIVSEEIASPASQDLDYEKQSPDESTDDFLDTEARDHLATNLQTGRAVDETHYLARVRSPPRLMPKTKYVIETENPTVTISQSDKTENSIRTAAKTDGRVEMRDRDRELKDFTNERAMIGSSGAVTADLFSRLNAGPPACSTHDLHTMAESSKTANDHDVASDETDFSSNKQSFRPVKGTDVFELFTMDSGEQFTVYVKENGRRYYIDWDTNEWKRLPDSWLSRGQVQSLENPVASGDIKPRTVGNMAAFSSLPPVDSLDDGRTNVFHHPTKGEILTYMFEKKRNVACFFHEISGSWLKMPLSWEKDISYIEEMIRHIQSVLPAWKDVRSIIAAIRASNYHLDDCIANYTAVQEMDQNALDVWLDDNSAAQKAVVQLEEKLDEKTAQFESLKSYKLELEQQIVWMEDTIAELRENLERSELERSAAVYREREQAKRLTTAMQAAQTAKHKKVARLHVDRSSYIVVQTSVRSVKTSLLAMRQSISKHFDALRILLNKSMTTAKEIGGIGKRAQSEMDELRNLYRKECLQRKLLYNQLQELRGNIRVFCRCRHDDRYSVALEFPTEGEIAAHTPQGPQKIFEFDKVYGPETTQEQVFEDTLPTIMSCADGYNICILAYGQTGSGKTYTMMGTDSNPGVNVRAIKELLRICQEREQIAYTLKVSVLEIYNETIVDLLASSEQATRLQTQTKGKQVLVLGITEAEVRTVEDVTDVLERGNQNRKVAQTAMNSSSSRSHLMLTLSLEGVDSVSKAVTRGKLMLVDLAGSERISRSEATGQRLVEAAAINKSLSALGQVFMALRTNALHIPYRNSKLTHLLQPALGGDAKM
ncbi:kinesin-like protein klp-3 isoform X2 [Corticium candelabrum]|uniref:kinesin-like protein klp-3 isoform X2 n=1 Tax=Corticium candelabrum TaxID=121492 RepID=UPI002E256622|nr:kinesin-like protein klp-3 isoform X2 [Corticium candelabrum]